MEHPPSGQLYRFNCSVVAFVDMKSLSFGNCGGPPLVRVVKTGLGLPAPTLLLANI